MTHKKSDVANVEHNLQRLLNSVSYRLAEDDVDFLQSTYGRESRVLAEYTKVERTLERERVLSTIIVFDYFISIVSSDFQALFNTVIEILNIVTTLFPSYQPLSMNCPIRYYWLRIPL